MLKLASTWSHRTSVLVPKGMEMYLAKENSIVNKKWSPKTYVRSLFSGNPPYFMPIRVVEPAGYFLLSLTVGKGL